MRHLLIPRSIAHYLIYRELAITAFKFRLAAGRFRESITKRLSGYIAEGTTLLHSFRDAGGQLGFSRGYVPRLTVPDHSRPTGGSFSRLVILSFAANDREDHEEEEKKRRARFAERRDRNRIPRATTSPTNLEVADRRHPPIARCMLTGLWCHSVFPFSKGRYPRVILSVPGDVSSWRNATRFRWIALRRGRKRENSSPPRSVRSPRERTWRLHFNCFRAAKRLPLVKPFATDHWCKISASKTRFLRMS